MQRVSAQPGEDARLREASGLLHSLTGDPAAPYSDLMVEPHIIEERLKVAFPDAEIQLKDLTGTKDHYEAVVVSAAFAGKTRIEQHQLVYRALGELMAGPVHALALRTSVPPLRSPE